MITALIVVDVTVALVMMAAVLLQTGYTAGMSSTFGGSSPQPYQGKKKGVDEFLARVTVIFAVAFGVLTLVLAHFWH
ncbi:MAG: preprotein translocase subunit SecG [Thermaerobacter sp.]|nr:preprotein translocase subunit SecG [Thermaerobacter sp.]